MIQMLKCPTCGGNIGEIDTIEVYEDGNTLTLYKIGECGHCGNHYQWSEEFISYGRSELEKIDSEGECEPDADECGSDPFLGCYTDDC